MPLQLEYSGIRQLTGLSSQELSDIDLDNLKILDVVVENLLGFLPAYDSIVDGGAQELSLKVKRYAHTYAAAYVLSLSTNRINHESSDGKSQVKRSLDPGLLIRFQEELIALKTDILRLISGQPSGVDPSYILSLAGIGTSTSVNPITEEM